MKELPAIIWGSRHITQERLEQYISSVIKHLKGRGISLGDRIVLIDNNSIEYVILLLALWRMGVVACPINPRWPVESILAACQSLNPKVILTTHKQILHNKKSPAATVTPKELISFDARQPEEITKADIPFDQEATIIWTSGSRGNPKAAVHTWGNHFHSALGSLETIQLKASDRWVLSLPLYHVSGISIVCRCFLAQATIVIPGEEELEETLRKTRPTHLSLVSTQLYRLLEHKENHEILKSLKCILLGGSAIPLALIEKALFLELPIYTSYGLTEMSSQVATGKVETMDQLCAKVLPYRQLKLDAEGQILVKGEVLFKGYLHQNKVTIPLTKDGWFCTGDLGKLENDCLSVIGRRDNMFICAGENVQPEEIENVLLRLSVVKQAVVIAKEDPEYGYRPIAFVKMHGHFNTQLLINHCAFYLPKIKIPIAFYEWPEELNQGLKISRKFFQERLGNLLGE